MSTAVSHKMQNGLYHHKMEPRHSIYSALLYAPAFTRLKTGHNTSKQVRQVYCVTVLNFIIQLGLLWVMCTYGKEDSLTHKLITTDTSRAKQQELQSYRKYETKGDRAGFLAEATEEENVEEDIEKQEAFFDHTKDSACTLHKGLLQCAPKSLHFTTEWDSLDTNSDGTWGIDEVRRSENRSNGNDNRRALYFDSIINSLQDRARWLSQKYNTTLYLSQDILMRRGIPKAYFDYWVGDAQFCSRMHSATCDFIVATGIFGTALTKGRIAAEYKGISDYHSASNYCTEMLKPHGFCEKSLPTSYAYSVRQRRGLCGQLSLQSAGVAANPDKPTEMVQVMLPRYSKIVLQTRTYSWLFVFFLIIILYLFYASMISEMKYMLRMMDFITIFPGLAGQSDWGSGDMSAQLQDNGEYLTEKRYEVKAIQRKHRIVLGITTFFRLVIFVVLIVFGTWFLLSQTSYAELVLNAVALTFVTSIDEMLYDMCLDAFDKVSMGMQGHPHCAPIEFYGRYPNGDEDWPAVLSSKHIWGLVIIPFMAIAVVLYWQGFVRAPIVEALDCACLQTGAHCVEAPRIQGPWWDHYWTHTLPATIHQIEAMRLQGM